jgi:bifunctional DNA-binding transcriptional regulator/antitoxin component of YhaV-PrlF toxin-antitoxin module
MNDLRTHIDTQGKVLIPAKLRKIMKFKPHDTLILRYINEQLVILKQIDVIQQIQADFKSRGDSSKSAVDEFLEMRQSERDLEKVRDNRPLEKLASGSGVQGAHGTEDRSVSNIHEDLSTGATTQPAAEVEFTKRSNDTV